MASEDMDASSDEVGAEIVRRVRDEGESARGVMKDLRARGVEDPEGLVCRTLLSAGLSPGQGQGKTRAQIANLHEYGRRWDEGEILDVLSAEIGFSPTFLRLRLKEAGYSGPGRGRRKSTVEVPNLEELAERWAEGAGEPLAALAKEADVSAYLLKVRFKEAGYIGA